MGKRIIIPTIFLVIFVSCSNDKDPRNPLMDKNDFTNFEPITLTNNFETINDSL